MYLLDPNFLVLVSRHSFGYIGPFHHILHAIELEYLIQQTAVTSKSINKLFFQLYHRFMVPFWQPVEELLDYAMPPLSFPCFTSISLDLLIVIVT
jgi:hypothetical protein